MFFSDDDVVVVSSVSAALKLNTMDFDLVLVDYDLDDGKGDQVVRALGRGQTKVPIIAVSSHEEGNTALRAAGADAVCAKKDFGNIREIVAKLLKP